MEKSCHLEEHIKVMSNHINRCYKEKCYKHKHIEEKKTPKEAETLIFMIQVVENYEDIKDNLDISAYEQVTVKEVQLT